MRPSDAPTARSFGGNGSTTTGLLASILLFFASVAQAANEGLAGAGVCAADETLTLRGATARLENDMFAGTDKDYTNGVSFNVVSHDIPGDVRPECLPRPIRHYAELIQRINPAFSASEKSFEGTQNAVLRFGQSMYTPEDYSATGLIPDDRPYAGLLYIGLALNRRKTIPESRQEMLDTRAVTVGVIGPWSQAEHAQNIVHDIKGVEKFRGWENQLNNEPALQLALDRKYRASRGHGAVIPGLSADMVRSLGFRLGNIETAAKGGIEVRVGWNIPNDFGSYPIRPGAENRPPSAVAVRGASAGSVLPAKRPRPGVHLLGILEAKAVAYDFSLDGNLLRDSHSVSRRPLVVEAAVGLSAQGILAGRGVRVAVMRVYRTREFEEQSPNHSYGSIALSVEF